jgi:hypothetical protein
VVEAARSQVRRQWMRVTRCARTRWWRQEMTLRSEMRKKMTKTRQRETKTQRTMKRNRTTQCRTRRLREISCYVRGMRLWMPQKQHAEMPRSLSVCAVQEVTSASQVRRRLMMRKKMN